MKEIKGWSTYALTSGLLVLRSGAGLVHAMSCGEAIEALIPCTSFLVASGEPAQPSGQCGEGAQSLSMMANTSAARRAICKCFVQSAPSFSANPDRVKLLPQLCNLNFAIPDTKVNCSQ